MTPQIIETESFTVIIIPKGGVSQLDSLPSEIRKLAKLWEAGATSRDIMNAFGMTGASDAGTTWVSQLRKIYPGLFPYRNKGSKRNGASIAALSKARDL